MTKHALPNVFSSILNTNYILLDYCNDMIIQHVEKEDDVKKINEVNKSIISYNNNSLIIFKQNSIGCLRFDLNYNVISNSKSLLEKKYIKKISLGRSHSIFLTKSGILYTDGSNKYGQLGINASIDSYYSEPQMITNLLNFNVLDISSGKNHNIALCKQRKNEDNTNTILYGWGYNFNNQLSLEDEYDNKGKTIEDKYIINTPTIINYFNHIPIKSIDSGLNFSAILSSKGVYLFGDNTNIQISKALYDLDIVSTARPLLLSTKDLNNTIKEIKCSSNSCLMLGENKSNQFLISTGKSYINKYYTANDKNLKFSLKNVIFSDIVIKFPYNQSTLKEEKIQKSLIIEEKQDIICITNNENYDDFASPREENRYNYNPSYKQSFMQDLNYGTNFTQSTRVNNLYLNFDVFGSETSKDILDNIDNDPRDELKSYISMIGLSLPSSYSNTDFDTAPVIMSFRPSNLPQKSKEEESLHKKLVQENRKIYFNYLKEKIDFGKTIEKKYKESKSKDNQQAKLWESEILPYWYKKKRDNEVKILFYDGVPPSLRGKIWLMCIGNRFSITTEYYEIEVKKAIDMLISIQGNDEKNSKDINFKYNIAIVGKEQSIKYIKLDVSRTFGYLGMFKDPNSQMSNELREILQAFVVSRPDIGYIQGLSYIAGMLLLYLDKFQSFVALMNVVLNPNIISFYRMNESQIQRRMDLFKEILNFNLPLVFSNFERINIQPELYLIEWIMTIFSKNLNIDLAARVWDLYMIEGIKAIFQAAIAILTVYKSTLTAGDYEICMSVLKGNDKCLFDIDQNELIHYMKNTKFSDSILFEIQKLEDEFIPI